MTVRKPFRLKVLEQLTDVLKTITPANGYEFDMADYDFEDDDGEGVKIVKRPRVFRGRLTFGENDPLPCLSILERPDALDSQDGQVNNPTTRGLWDLFIQGFAIDDPLHQTDPAYRFMAEVKEVLGKEKDRKKPGSNTPDILGLGDRKVNAITGFAIGTGSVRPADEFSDNAYFYLVLTLELTENTTRPYD